MAEIRVAVDAMGGDHAPGEIVMGTVKTLSAEPELKLYLLGDSDLIAACLKGVSYPEERLEIFHTEQVIKGDEDPGLAIRRKKNPSMLQAVQMVARGQAEVVLSAGNTGAFMAGGLLVLGRLPGISRPCLLIVAPSFTGEPVVVLDVGANMDASPEQLVQYAYMGRIYAQQLLGRPEPRVALLNVGRESNKGNMQLRKAHLLFQEYVEGFCGNIEGTDLFFSTADVVVCDGFVGNVLLKITEGLTRGIFGYMKQEFIRKGRYKLGAALLKPALKNLRANFDDTEYGGAPLLGVKGLCIKCHGSSRARSVEQALLKQAVPFVRNNVLDLFKEALAKSPTPEKEVQHDEQS